MTKKLMDTTLLALLIGGLCLAAVAGATPTCDGTPENCFMVRVDDANYSSVLSNHALTFVRDVRAGSPKLVLVTGPTNTLPETTLAALDGDADVLGAELIGGQAMTEGATGAGVDQSHTSIVDAMSMTGLSTGPEASYFSSAPSST